MIDLIAFITARLDETERLGLAAVAIDSPTGYYVLRRVMADRKTIGLHRGEPAHNGPPYCVTCGSGEPHEYPVDWPCQTVRLVAVTYSDHPDYRQEWQPQAPA